ncbi:MAG: hypothetical protein HY000_37340 [Planctomycetes bacterium]|nr:hypothetical protein [Planctomycetota bacterium]
MPVEKGDLRSFAASLGTLAISNEEDPEKRPVGPPNSQATANRIVDLDAVSAALGPIEEQRVKDIEANRKLRQLMAWLLFLTFAPANMATIVLFFFNGFGLTNLSDTALLSLQGATVAQLAAIMVIIAKYLFPKTE